MSYPVTAAWRIQFLKSGLRLLRQNITKSIAVGVYSGVCKTGSYKTRHSLLTFFTPASLLCLCLLLFLTGCNGIVDPETKKTQNKATLAITVSDLPSGCVNPLTYVAVGYPERPSQSVNAATAVYSMLLTQNIYVATIEFSQPGDYTISISCIEGGNEIFQSYRRYIVKFKSTAALLRNANQPLNHPPTDQVACANGNGCHTLGTSGDYIITNADHGLMSNTVNCKGCHGVDAIGQFNGHIDSGSADCDSCHTNAKQVNFLPVSIQNPPPVTDPGPEPVPDPNPNPVVTPAIEISVAAADLVAESACFNSGALDAAVYVYTGNPLRPFDINASDTPTPTRYDLIQDSNGNYAAVVNTSASVDYRIAVVCGVSVDSADSANPLVYLSHRWYRLALKDTTNLIVPENQPASHPAILTDACESCHTIGGDQQYLVTQLNHTVVSQVCTDCHVLPSLHVDADSNPVSVSQGQNCAEAGCHNVSIWAQARNQNVSTEPPPDPVIDPTLTHDQVSAAILADCKVCHAADKPNTVWDHDNNPNTAPVSEHQSTTFQCGYCHSETAWCSFVNPIVESILQDADSLCPQCSATPSDCILP